MAKFTNRDGEIRIYDGSTTPYYLEIKFTGGDFSGPIGVPEPEEQLFLDRGRGDTAVYTRARDDEKLAPVDVSFTVTITEHETFGYLMDWLEGKTVNSKTIVTTKGTTQRDGVNNTPTFVSSGKLCCNVEYMLDGDTDYCWHYNEVWFPLSQCTVSESDDGVTVSLTGKCYGTIVRDSAFTAGTDVTA